MKNISLKEISNAVNGELYGKDYKGSYSFGIDSRNFENHNFFIPLKGDRFDGHNYIKDVDEKAICVLCSYCLLYTSPSPRDGLLSRMPSSA